MSSEKVIQRQREPFLGNKDIAAQNPLSSIDVPRLPVVSVCGIGADEK